MNRLSARRIGLDAIHVLGISTLWALVAWVGLIVFTMFEHMSLTIDRDVLVVSLAYLSLAAPALVPTAWLGLILARSILASNLPSRRWTVALVLPPTGALVAGYLTGPCAVLRGSTGAAESFALSGIGLFMGPLAFVLALPVSIPAGFATLRWIERCSPPKTPSDE